MSGRAGSFRRCGAVSPLVRPFAPQLLDSESASESELEQEQGSASLHHKQGWTALAIWDRTGDHRLNSNSVFFAEGFHDFEAIQSIAAERFTSLWSRITRTHSVFLRHSACESLNTSREK